MRNKLGRIAVITAYTAAFAAAQTIDARDMFYSAADMVGGNTQRPPANTNNEPVKPPPPPVVRHKPVPKDPEAHFQTVSHTADLALGLRYSILRKADSGLSEVRPGTVFHSGDKIRVSVMGNQKGYLYVIARGSSGVWTPLFPHPDSSQQHNEIVAGRKYQVPSGDGEYFLFDNQAGSEKLFVLLSKTPVDDLDTLILGLTPDGQSKPPEPSRPPLLEARKRADDQMVDRLRAAVQERDLVFTRADSEPAAGDEPREKAVYVVNKNSDARSNARVVVDLTLNHQ